MASTARYLLGRMRVGISCFLGFLALITSINAAALGLGEIELDSALNEKLEARIELMDIGTLVPSEILISLASSDDFDRVGVERFFYLTDLQFEVAYDRGDAVVTVTSSRPVTEPYLNFIVEVLWPNGRLLKEYTVLLDPPTFSQAAAPAVSAPVESSNTAATSGRVQRQQPERAATQVQVAPTERRSAEPSPLDQDVVGDEYRMTDRNDTLWAIASRTRASNRVSVQQNMLAIQRLNPEAFIDGNINLLKAGYTLRLPDEEAATRLSQDEALAAVSSQNEAWRSGVSVASADTPRAAAPASDSRVDETSQRRSPVDATAAAPAAATSAAENGELRIVAGQGDSATGLADAEVTEDLAAVLEENDRLSREIDELTYQKESGEALVSNQLAVKDRQLEVRDQQIAELQQRLAELEAQSQAAAAAPAASATQNQNQNTTQPNWWENPMIQYGGLGVLVLALAGWMLMARRRRDTEEDFFEAAEPSMGAQSAKASSTTYRDDSEDDEDEQVLEQLAEEEVSASEELPGSETSDVIGEADIYIAYGRYPQAIGLLLGVLEDDAGRNDVRLKLLELFSETNDREAFNDHLALLVEHCDDEDALMTARELESRFGEKSISLEEVISDESDVAESNIDDDDETALAGELSAIDSDEDFDLEPMEEVAELDITSAAEDEDVGFELELDEPERTQDRADRGASDDLGGDLGIDFDPGQDDDAPAAVAGPSAGAEQDEELLDLAEMGIAAESDNSTNSERGTRVRGAESLAATQTDSDVAVAEEDDFDFQDEGDSANTKLDLARAYIDMGDADGARDILKEVLGEGNAEQQQRAQAMLDSL